MEGEKYFEKVLFLEFLEFELLMQFEMKIKYVIMCVYV